MAPGTGIPGARRPPQKGIKMATANGQSNSERRHPYTVNAIRHRADMQTARDRYEQAADAYRHAVARALEAGVSAVELADALGIARSSVYDAARRT